MRPVEGHRIAPLPIRPKSAGRTEAAQSIPAMLSQPSMPCTGTMG